MRFEERREWMRVVQQWWSGITPDWSIFVQRGRMGESWCFERAFMRSFHSTAVGVMPEDVMSVQMVEAMEGCLCSMKAVTKRE